MTTPTTRPSDGDQAQAPQATAGGAATDVTTRRPWGLRPTYGFVAKMAMAAVLLLVWEAGMWLFGPRYAARPSDMAPVVVDVLTSSEFLGAFAGTMVPIFQGLVIAVTAAVLVGLAMGQIRWLQWSLRGYTYALFALPMVAVVPLVTMWLGYSSTGRLAVIIFAAYFPMALNVYDGARSVSRHHLEVAATYRAPRRAVWFGVVLPSSLPYLLSGIRLASGRALVGAVVAEYIMGIEGLGFYILLNARSFRHNEAMVAVLALAFVGVGILVFVKWATRRFAPWYDAQRGT